MASSAVSPLKVREPHEKSSTCSDHGVERERVCVCVCVYTHTHHTHTHTHIHTHTN